MLSPFLLLSECRRLRSKSDFLLRLLGTLAARNPDGSPCFCDGFASGGRSHTGHCVSGRNALANEPVQPDPEAELTRQREEIARLWRIIHQANNDLEDGHADWAFAIVQQVIHKEEAARAALAASEMSEGEGA